MPQVRCAEAACVHNDAGGCCEANSIYVSSIGRSEPRCMTFTTVEARGGLDAAGVKGRAEGARRIGKGAMSDMPSRDYKDVAVFVAGRCVCVGD